MTEEYESDSEHHFGEENASTTTKRRQNLVDMPVIPRPLAIFCLVANIIIPGSGTIVSAFSVLCFRYKKKNCLEMINMCLANVGIGLFQLITVVFLLIGWFWSIIWGCALVGHSINYKKDGRRTASAPIRLTVKPATSSERDEG